MPTNYDWGSGWARGIETATSAIADWQKQKSESEGHKILADYALQTGVATPEKYAEYLKAPPAKQNAMLGSWVAIQHAKQQEGEALDRDRRTRLAFQQYNQQLEQQQYERNFRPSASTVAVPTGRQISPFGAAQAGGGLGVPYAPDYTVPETDQYTAIATSPRGTFDIQPPPFKPPTTIQPIRSADTGQIVGYPLPTGRGSVTYREGDIGEGAGGEPPKVTRLHDPDTNAALPYYSVRLPGTKQHQIVGAPDEGGVRLNPETNLYEQWNGKTWVALSQALQMQIRMEKMRQQRQGGGAPTPTPSPTATPEPGSPDAPLPGSVISRLFGGGRATPTPMPSPVVVPGGPAGGPLTPQDQEALAWASANPNDPRAAAIFAKLGIAR
jgi:hypothetical protein